jgi:hypothetical protein
MLGLALGPSSGRRLRVDPERRFFTPPLKAGLGAAEWVNPDLASGLRSEIYNYKFIFEKSKAKKRRPKGPPFCLHFP